MSKPKKPRKPKQALALPLAALAIFLPMLAACGGSGDSSGGSSAAPPAAPASGGAAGRDSDQLVKFTQCMRQNGVPQWPERVDLDSPQFRAAAQKCKSLRPHGASAPSAPSRSPGEGQSSRRRAVLGAGDGVIPDGASVSVFDEEIPAVGKLDRDLLDALQRAAKDAKADGIGFRVNSGWRSTEYQQRLLQDADAKYGSQKEAARWVSTPKTSAHVKGEAVDIGPPKSAAWLSEHGAGYGLCQIYRNEPWHYELRPDAVGKGCPPKYADPTQDPRTQP